MCGLEQAPFSAGNRLTIGPLMLWLWLSTSFARNVSSRATVIFRVNGSLGCARSFGRLFPITAKLSTSSGSIFMQQPAVHMELGTFIAFPTTGPMVLMFTCGLYPTAFWFVMCPNAVPVIRYNSPPPCVHCIAYLRILLSYWAQRPRLKAGRCGTALVYTKVERNLTGVLE